MSIIVAVGMGSQGVFGVLHTLLRTVHDRAYDIAEELTPHSLFEKRWTHGANLDRFYHMAAAARRAELGYPRRILAEYYSYAE